MEKSFNFQIRPMHMILLLTVIGAVLRFVGIEANSLWLDELFSVRVSNPNSSFLKVFEDTSIRDVHPPFYQSLLWAWYKVVGYGEFSGRYLSFIVGVLHIPAIYVLGKKMFNTRVGFISSFLLCINFFYIWYSQETRSFQLLSFLTTLSFIFFLDTQKNKKYSFIFYTLVLVLLANTHFFGFLPILSQAILILIFRNNIWKYVISGVFVVVSLIPVLSSLLNSPVWKSTWIKKPTAFFIFEYFRDYFSEAILSTVMPFLVLIGIFFLFKHKRNRENLIIILWLGVGLLVPYFRSVTSAPILTARNTIIVLPAFLILISYTLSQINKKWVTNLILTSFIFLSFHNFVLKKKLYGNDELKDNWRAIAKLVLEKAGNSVPFYSNKKWAYEAYLGVWKEKVEIQDISNIKDMSKIDHKAFYLLYGHDYIFTSAEIEALTSYKLVEEITLKKVGIRMFLKQ